MRNIIKLTISCLNVSLKKLIVWLQLHPKLIASDYITTGRPLGRTNAVHSCVTPKGTWSGGSEAWLPNPSSLTYFNRNGRVRILGKTSWYASWQFVSFESQVPYGSLAHCPMADAEKNLQKFDYGRYFFGQHIMHIFCGNALGCMPVQQWLTRCGL